MRIELLGPAIVILNGTLVTPQAPKPRHALALLALYANSVVPIRTLIEELWGDNPPASVTTTLQTYIYQLRKSLKMRKSRLRGRNAAQESSDAVLQTYAGGYILHAPPDAVDVLQFERLTQRGRLQLRAGETETAAATLRAALDLWRGPAFVDVHVGRVLEVEALRLDEIRKNALEWRIDADLRLERHHELLGELVGLAAGHRTHEGFHGQLMLALYRAGRRSDALGAYQRALEALANELGGEPSPLLQALHRAILADDPALTASTPRDVGSMPLTEALVRPG